MLTDELLETIEHVIAGIAAFVVFVCTVGGPHLNWGPTREQLTKACVSSSRQIVQLESTLQTAEHRAKAQKAELAAAANSVTALQARVSALQKERDTFTKQTSDEVTRVKELESQLQAAKTEIAKLKDAAAKEDLNGKLDTAVVRANKAEDRIRELTLQLHNAGIWP
jgi:predicted  nucleic acid-binding Zn-ribbon protein